jgi:beta-lactamase superfamily II metal-dependent hydrolase
MSRPSRFLLLLLGVLLASACERSKPAEPAPVAPAPEVRRYFGAPADGKLHVYFFNVGYGDATLIISPTGTTVLVDAGPAQAGSTLANRLPELLNGPLDKVILTHPHTDHFGGLAEAVDAVGAKELMTPQLANSSKDYKDLIASLTARGMKHSTQSTGGLQLPLGGHTTLTMLWPRGPQELIPGEPSEELNSVVMRLTYKDTAVLLAGDARKETEEHLLTLQMPLRATLLKVPAHGMEAASSEGFLAAVRPGAAILSTRAGDLPNIPAQPVLERLGAVGARVFRTDMHGEVHAFSDGNAFTLVPQRRPMGDAEVFPGGLEEALKPLVAEEPPASRVRQVKATEADLPRVGKAPEERAQAGRVVDIDDLEAQQEAKERTRGVPQMAAGNVEKFYVASRNSNVFHRPMCSNAKRILDKNRRIFHTRAEAAQQHQPAKDCNP